MEFNLVEDYKRVLLKKAKEDTFLYIPKKLNDDQTIIYKFLEYQSKLEFAGPHIVKKTKDFSCPEECEKGLEALTEIISAGGDIRPFLSTRAAELDKYDGLYADWGVLHFHLGDKMMKKHRKTFVVRGEYVLFAFLKNNTVYFIDVYDHNQWANIDVLQKLYNNWPEIFRAFITKEKKINRPTEQRELEEDRNTGSSYLVQLVDLNGEPMAVAPFNYGQTTAKVAANIILAYQRTIQAISKLEKEILNSSDADLKKHGYSEMPLLKIVDVIGDEILVIDENEPTVTIPLNLRT